MEPILKLDIGTEIIYKFYALIVDIIDDKRISILSKKTTLSVLNVLKDNNIISQLFIQTLCNKVETFTKIDIIKGISILNHLGKNGHIVKYPHQRLIKVQSIYLSYFFINKLNLKEIKQISQFNRIIETQENIENGFEIFLQFYCKQFIMTHELLFQINEEMYSEYNMEYYKRNYLIISKDIISKGFLTNIVIRYGKKNECIKEIFDYLITSIGNEIIHLTLEFPILCAQSLEYQNKVLGEIPYNLKIELFSAIKLNKLENLYFLFSDDSNNQLPNLPIILIKKILNYHLVNNLDFGWIKESLFKLNWAFFKYLNREHSVNFFKYLNSTNYKIFKKELNPNDFKSKYSILDGFDMELLLESNGVTSSQLSLLSIDNPMIAMIKKLELTLNFLSPPSVNNLTILMHPLENMEHLVLNIKTYNTFIMYFKEFVKSSHQNLHSLTLVIEILETDDISTHLFDLIENSPKLNRIEIIIYRYPIPFKFLLDFIHKKEKNQIFDRVEIIFSGHLTNLPEEFNEYDTQKLLGFYKLLKLDINFNLNDIINPTYLYKVGKLHILIDTNQHPEKNFASLNQLIAFSNSLEELIITSPKISSVCQLLKDINSHKSLKYITVYLKSGNEHIQTFKHDHNYTHPHQLISQSSLNELFNNLSQITSIKYFNIIVNDSITKLQYLPKNLDTKDFISLNQTSSFVKMQ